MLPTFIIISKKYLNQLIYRILIYHIRSMIIPNLTKGSNGFYKKTGRPVNGAPCAEYQSKLVINGNFSGFNNLTFSVHDLVKVNTSFVVMYIYSSSIQAKLSHFYLTASDIGNTHL